MLTLSGAFQGNTYLSMTMTVGFMSQSFIFNIYVAPATSNFSIVQTAQALLTGPSITSMAMMSPYMIAIQGSNLNNGSFVNLVSFNGTICPVVNVTLSQLYSLCPSALNTWSSTSVVLSQVLQTTTSATSFTIASDIINSLSIFFLEPKLIGVVEIYVQYYEFNFKLRSSKL